MDIRPLHPTSAFVLFCAAAFALPAIAQNPASLYPPPHTFQTCGADSRAPLVPPSIAPLTEGPQLTIEFRDADTKQMVAARVGVFSAPQSPVSPQDPGEHLFQSVYGWTHFYSAAPTTLTVVEGDVTVKAGRGFEYMPVETTLTVTGDTTVVIELERFIDMNALGWYSGDTHVHISHPPVVYAVQPSQVITVMDAEGLNFVNSMEEAPYFTGTLDPASTPEHLLYFSKEERNAHFGHLSLVGLKEWIPDQTCYLLDHVCARTLDAAIASMVHAQDPRVTVVATHPLPTWDMQNILPWPGGGVWRGMPIDLLDGCIDAVDVMCYTHQLPPGGVLDYFHALTLGFRVPPSAGTDALIGSATSLPAGGYRAYVRLDDGEPLSFEGWIDAFRRGRSFVTNYPLFTEFEVGGAEPGDSLEHDGGPLSGFVSARCIVPVEKVEIVGDGHVLTTVTPEPGSDGRELTSTFEVDASGIRWIVARATGTAVGWHPVDANGLFAMTAPVYLAPSPSDPTPPGLDPLQVAAARFRQISQDIEEFFEYAEFTPESRAAFDSAAAYAVDYYEGAWPDPPGPFALRLPPDKLPNGMPMVRTVTPTFKWKRSFDPDPGDVVTYALLIDTSSDLAAPPVVSGILDTSYTLPPEDALVDGATYYFGVRAVDETNLTAKSTPASYPFVVSATPTGVESPPPDAWALRTAYPNPFNPSVHLVCAIPPGAGSYELAVYDVGGRRVRTIYSGSREPGVYEEHWDGRAEDGAAAASGVYFVRLRPHGEAPVVRKIVLLK